jgi:hypothetical protein
MSIYNAQGLPMLPTHASDLSGGNSVEASLADLIDRMQTRRLRVFKHLEPFWREYRLYRRAPDGKILKEDDDCISAVRYTAMSLRHARPVGEVGQRRNRGPQQALGMDYDRFNRDSGDDGTDARPGHYGEREMRRRAQSFKYD